MDERLSGLTLNSQLWVESLRHQDSKHYADAYHNVFYQVVGEVFDKQIQSFLNFDYNFNNLESAEAYFDLIKKNYVDSFIKIYEKTRREIRTYT